MSQQNNGIQLKNFGGQLNDIGMQIQNMGIQMQNISQDIRMQMQTLGNQISNIGMQVFNIGNLLNQIMQMNMINSMNNRFREHNLYGNNMNNFINNDFNIEDNKMINIFFKDTEHGEKTTITISEENTIEELRNIYFKKIGKNPDIEKNKFWFLKNGFIVQLDNKTKIKDFKLPNGYSVLSDACTIDVVRIKDITN